ncbi:biofilm regulation diguanylate cyclase SiaD [Paraburkholderia caballeronis]|uniref:diguanylate cyclase n=1 Tax=Paraburkholderia caballeronis TaxID=416943 RepID=A0A1H7FC41_9BURK|nr:biofilm regulation diguanylate cyclase SiaD [Paraburkholderia caballeronis]PXW24070.1 diguanylate cyclase (GGDEF)-like protein [Paraburkholderia caballeronis]PXW99834.1 diguanylate cyclase (GGDEF)-like protein [Paraburkholderia caballeronis]RAJ96788.1 diguanylate cyclase (GGDEF)-like protein [Paraburkholderia caballeronis]SEE74449.1 diguanylate cyclase (GGDEF) domain-containing protein [Paraburkholderia caballeronis]SEK23676.1 diguanylate cyclase (GGDEF) domain-containing protein [Paraburkh
MNDELDRMVEQLLADPQYEGHPLRAALSLVYRRALGQNARSERIAQISDGFQAMARDAHSTLSGRYESQSKRLGKILRIADRYQALMRDRNALLQEASMLDPLTGIPNRRQLMVRLNEESARSARTGRPFVIAMLDADYFKQINDRWGHDVGDRVLMELGHAMLASKRQYDLCGRWGGEEFLLVLPDTTLDGAGTVVERMHRNIAEVRVPVGDRDETIGVTVSIGAAVSMAGETYAQTLGRADAALRRAKQEGRNRTVFDGR